MDTIFALATAPGKAGVAVIRVSGPDAEEALVAFCTAVPKDGRGLRLLKYENEVIDEALCLHFPAGRSFTGEEVVELHLHGSPAVVARVLSVLGTVPNLRSAEPGEFTRRAFDNGRLDLSQVEGLADLIEAETEAQRRQALKVFSGALGQKAADWKERLKSIAARLMAALDFADEEIPEDVLSDVAREMQDLSREFEAEVVAGQGAELIRSGFEVAIVGAPNVGKSTLLNKISGREAAITSDIAGTTRDVIEVRMDLNGLAVTFLDTAGIRDTDDAVEAIGVDRARQRAESADLRVFLVEADEMSDLTAKPDDVILKAKGDLEENPDGSISGLTGAGVDDLISHIKDILSDRVSEPGLAIRERHRVILTEAAQFLTEGQEALRLGDDVIASELTMSAIRRMDTLVGRVDVEALLGEVFSSFCIGK